MMQHAATMLEWVASPSKRRRRVRPMDDTMPLPPCHGRDEWTRESGYDGANIGDPDRQLAERAAITFAQVVCMTQCDQRTACMEQALAYESMPDEVGSHYVWGGYRGYERARILNENLPALKPPASRHYYGTDTRDAYLALFARSDGDIFDFCRRNNLAPKTALDRAVGYVWQLRIEEGDPWVMLHDGDVADAPVDATSKEPPAAVRAA